jgi:hypothetical protein
MRAWSLPIWVALAALWVLRVVTAAMLAVDAYIHADLAVRYDANRDTGLSQGTLFRWEAGAAALAALVVLVVFGRAVWSLVAWALALVVAASAFGAVMIYAHYDIGRLGPLPNMYEPFWYGEKTRAAVAEGIATGTAFLGLVLATWMVWSRKHAVPRQMARVDRKDDHVGGRAS